MGVGLPINLSYEAGSLRGSVDGMSLSLGGVLLYVDGVYSPWIKSSVSLDSVVLKRGGREVEADDPRLSVRLREGFAREGADS